MVSSAITPELVGFLRDRIHSYEELEVLLLVRQTPTQAWRTELAAARLKFPEATVIDAAEQLLESGLLGAEGTGQDRTYRYKPESPELATLADQLAHAFEHEPVALVRLMNDNAVERVRAAMRMFADAFILRKKRGQDG